MPIDHRHRHAGGEHDYESGEREPAVAAYALDQPAGGKAAQYGEWRHHEDEVAQAVIERRPRHHGDDDRQECGERDDQQAGAARRRQAAVGRRDRAPMPPTSASASMISGSLSDIRCGR